MAEKDIYEKKLEDYADVFADIVNVLLFNGEQFIDPNALVDELPKSIYKADDKVHEQERDTAKSWLVNSIKIAFIGIENQTAVDDVMPVRVFGYDGSTYRKQLADIDDIKRRNVNHRKNDEEPEEIPKLYPVTTLVLYFGTKHWDKPTNLIDSLDIPDKLKPYVADYKINLFEIAFLEDDIIAEFKSDFKYVAQLFQQERLVRDGIIDSPNLTIGELQHATAVLDLLRTFTGDNRFENAYNETLKGGHVDMFTLFDTYEKIGEDRGEKRGIVIGEERGIAIGSNQERTNQISLMLNRGKTPEEISDFCGYSIAEIRAVQKNLNS